MTYSVPVQPSSGTVTLNGSSCTYEPSQDARAAAAVSAGPDVASITVVASDGQSSTPVTFSVPVIPPNQAPTPGTPSVGTPVTATGAVSGQLNFTDPDGDPMSYNVPMQPASGSVSVTGRHTPSHPIRLPAMPPRPPGGGPREHHHCGQRRIGLALGDVQRADHSNHAANSAPTAVAVARCAESEHRARLRAPSTVQMWMAIRCPTP